MVHDQKGGVLAARIVKAVDGSTRDEREGASPGYMGLVADAQHQLAFDDVEELVAPAMVVRSRARGTGRDATFPD